ncbi:transglycosylase SLT domain-containing protein [Cryomorphaceae bacterium]|nr:transglycosylase SLT domain-containing protein [Cryomorphaceae bacterium]
MKKFLQATGLLAVLFVLTQLFIYSDKDVETDDVTFEETFERNYNVYALNLPNEPRFMDETVPVSDPDVLERLDRELLVNTYWQSNGLLLLKRSNKYFPIIEPILAEMGVPDDFKYLAVAESGLQNIVSPAGAAGFWQILKSTGPEYGLEVNKEIDERYHLEKATYAACDYLLEAKEKFGTWSLAAASYNMGMNGLERQLERQKVNSYWNLLLNPETSRYVFRIMAIKEVMEHPEKYGFHYREKDLYTMPDLYDAVVDSSVTHWSDFAQEKGISYKTLKYYNPWLRESYLRNPSEKEYVIKLPTDTSVYYREKAVE